MLHCQHIPCADPFRAATFMLQTFQTTSKVPLGHGSILSDAVGVDGLTLSSKPSVVIVLDGLKPYYCNKFSFETFDVISV